LYTIYSVGKEGVIVMSMIYLRGSEIKLTEVKKKDISFFSIISNLSLEPT
jgi:hypothetical protein